MRSFIRSRPSAALCITPCRTVSRWKGCASLMTTCYARTAMERLGSPWAYDERCCDGRYRVPKRLGAMHALSHPVGANYNTHHGTTNAVVMLSVLEFNRAAIEERIERLAAYLDIDGGFDGFVTHLRGLNESLGIPSTLGNLGVKSQTGNCWLVKLSKTHRLAQTRCR